MAHEIRSAAAMAGVVDEQLLVHDASRAFSSATTIEELVAARETYIFAIECAISTETVDLLTRLYELRRTVLSFE
jgi:2-C-methyl-D-erythritol 4-phosphate cytidylyltransferase